MNEAASQQAQLYVEQDMLEAQTRGFAGGSVAIYSARCPGKETPNEDSAALIPVNARCGVFVVADGLGGGRAGEEASHIAVGTIKEAVEQTVDDDSSLCPAILNGIERANRKVLELEVGAATTVAVAEIQDHAVRCYHVGDSMILVVGQRGKIKLQTISHSPVAFAVEAGLLNEAEAMHHEARHIVSNAIGKPGMRIEVGSKRALAPRDTVLLTSDGLVDNLHLGEIVERMRVGKIEMVAHRLATDARARMTQPQQGQPCKPDDLTFLAYRRAR